MIEKNNYYLYNEKKGEVMENTQKMAYAEVGKILDILGENYKKKVPTKLRELFYKEDNPDVDINPNNINDKKISRKALIILSILNLKYWEDDPQKKQRLKIVYLENEVLYREKFKNNNWINEKKEKEINTVSVTTELVVPKETLGEKIRKLFKKIFKRK